MNTQDIIILAVVLTLVGAIALYLVCQKKKGSKCLGCPYGAKCTGREKEESCTCRPE